MANQFIMELFTFLYDKSMNQWNLDPNKKRFFKLYFTLYLYSPLLVLASKNKL